MERQPDECRTVVKAMDLDLIIMRYIFESKYIHKRYVCHVCFVC